MIHPRESDLALYAGGDLGLIERWRTGRHVAACPSCRDAVAGFRTAAASLRTETESLPASLDWGRLSAEMAANIHLGLEAGECVATVRPHAVMRPAWRAAAVMAGLCALVAGAWYVNPVPRRTAHRLEAPRVEIRYTPTGLEVNQNGAALVLLHGPGNSVRPQKPLITSSPGTLRARYVDDSGQMTINHVYSE